MTALAHLSLMEVYDAQGKLEEHQRTFNALQTRLEAKKKKMIRSAVKKAEKEGLKVWKAKLRSATGAKPSQESLAVVAAKRKDAEADAKKKAAAKKVVAEKIKEEDEKKQDVKKAKAKANKMEAEADIVSKAALPA